MPTVVAQPTTTVVVIDEDNPTVAASVAYPVVAVDERLQGVPGVGVPTGGTTGQVLAKASNTDYDDHWIDPTGGGADLATLHAGLLAVKVWDTGTSSYVWSGDGSEPSADAYTRVMFIDPDGTHDPTTSTGGRTSPGDLWETGEVVGGGGSGGLQPADVPRLFVSGAHGADIPTPLQLPSDAETRRPLQPMLAGQVGTHFSLGSIDNPNDCLVADVDMIVSVSTTVRFPAGMVAGAAYFAVVIDEQGDYNNFTASIDLTSAAANDIYLPSSMRYFLPAGGVISFVFNQTSGSPIDWPFLDAYIVADIVAT